jgi:hypothetical protein
MRGVAGSASGGALCAAALFQIAETASETARGRGFLDNSMFFSELWELLQV